MADGGPGQLAGPDSVATLRADVQAVTEAAQPPDEAAVDALASRLNIEAAKQIQLGDFDTALWLLHSVDALTAQRAGERAAHHRRTMLNNFGCLEQRRGRPEAAYGYMSQAIALGCTDNPHVLLNAVAVLEKLDQHPEVAVGYSRVCIRLLEDQLQGPPKAQQKAAYMLTLARFHLARALDRSVRRGLGRAIRPEAVEHEYRTALELATTWLGAAHPTTLKVQKHVQAYQRKQPAGAAEVPEGHPAAAAGAVAAEVSRAPTPALGLPPPGSVGRRSPSAASAGVPALNLSHRPPRQCETPNGAERHPVADSSPSPPPRRLSPAPDRPSPSPASQPSPSPLPDIPQPTVTVPPSCSPHLLGVPASPSPAPPVSPRVPASPASPPAALPSPPPAARLHPGGPGRPPPQPSSPSPLAVVPHAPALAHPRPEATTAVPRAPQLLPGIASCPAEPLPEPAPAAGDDPAPRRPPPRETVGGGGGSPMEVAQRFVLHTRVQAPARQPAPSPAKPNMLSVEDPAGSPVSSVMRPRSPAADRVQSSPAPAAKSPDKLPTSPLSHQSPLGGVEPADVDLNGLQCMLHDLSGHPEEGLTNYYLDSNNRLWAGEQGQRQKEREVRAALERSLRLLTTENEALRQRLAQLQGPVASEEPGTPSGRRTADSAVQTALGSARSSRQTRSPRSPSGPVLETFAQSLQSSLTAALPTARSGSPELSPLKVAPRRSHSAGDGAGHASPLLSEGPSHGGTWYDDLPNAEDLPVPPPVFLQPTLPLVAADPIPSPPFPLGGRPRTREVAPADRSRWRSYSLDEQRRDIVYPAVLDLSPARGREPAPPAAQRRAKSARQWPAGRGRPAHFPIDQRLAQHLQAIHQGKEPPPPPPDAPPPGPAPLKPARGHRPCAAHPGLPAPPTLRAALARPAAPGAAPRAKGGRETDPEAWRRLYHQTPHSLRGDWL